MVYVDATTWKNSTVQTACLIWDNTYTSTPISVGLQEWNQGTSLVSQGVG